MLTVTSLPPRPPSTPLPSRPLQARSGTSNHREWHGVRVQYARLQYRDDKDQEWSTIADSYEPMIDRSIVPEPYNVEQVWFLETGGIRLRQCDSAWRSQIDVKNRVCIEVATSSFIVTFKAISNIVVSESTSVSEKGVESQWCIFHFNSIEAPTCESEILRPPSDPSAEIEDPSTFPLAAFKDLASVYGRQFRLAFQRKKTIQTIYAFAWPAVLDSLAGRPFVYDKKCEQDYRSSLDNWAMKNKKTLASFTLRDVQPQSRKPNEPRFEWHLERLATPQASSSSIPSPFGGTLPVFQSPYEPVMSSSTSAARPPPFTPLTSQGQYYPPPPSSSAEWPSSGPHWVSPMPPSIRPANLKRTYDEAIGEGEAFEMEGAIESLARTLGEKKLRAEATRKAAQEKRQAVERARQAAERAQQEADGAQEEANNAQALLDGASAIQKKLLFAEKRVRKE